MSKPVKKPTEKSAEIIFEMNGWRIYQGSCNQRCAHNDTRGLCVRGTPKPGAVPKEGHSDFSYLVKIPTLDDYVPLDDHVVITVNDLVHAAEQGFKQMQLDEQHSVVVYCTAGRSRSLAVAILMIMFITLESKNLQLF